MKFDYVLIHLEMENILRGTRWKIKEFIDSGSSSYLAIIEKEES